jgi:hypothetical protein
VQGLGPEAVDTPLCLGAELDETGLAEHPEMLGHRRLADRDGLHEIAHRPLCREKQIKDAAPIRFGENFEGGSHGG